MNPFLRNTISKLCNAISAPVAATRDALAKRLHSVRESASLLYNRMMENMKYEREKLKGIVKNEAEEEAKEQQQDDDHDDTVAKIKLVYEGKRVKEFRLTENLNGPNITPHIKMRTRLIYSFKSEIHRGAGEIVDYSKTLTSLSGMFTSLEEIQICIEECEQKRLDLQNVEVWSRAYLPTRRKTGARGNYEGKVIFKHV